MRHTARLAGPLAAGALGAGTTRGAPHCEAGEKDTEKRLDEKTCAGRRAALAARWVEEEGRPGYTPPRGTWLDPTPRSAIPGLKRRLTDECRPGSDSADSADVARKLQARCHDTKFSLAIALLGSSLFGHASPQEEDVEAPAKEEATEDQRQGATLMRQLAEKGVVEGLCGWAYCLLDGEVAGGEVAYDAPKALGFHEAAARGGYAQSMHELGVLYYTGDDGVECDQAAAVYWFREAAQRGVSGSMYLLAECLLEGEGDSSEAYRWLASAAELGHRGARQRILASAATAAAPQPQTERQHIALEAQKARYAALTGLRVSRVTEAVLAPEV